MTLAEVCQEIALIYRDYTGTGMIIALFFLSVLYIIWDEKESVGRLILGILPLVIAVLFACPLFAWIIYLFLDSEIYYRLLWLLPLTVVIAYAGVRIILRMQGLKRLVSLLAICGIIIICGDYVYDSPYFEIAENAYHVPDTVVAICDEIQVEGREVRAVFPSDMVQYVRQYTPYVCMQYGREMIVERWSIGSELYETYELGLPDGIVRADKLAEIARKYSVHYIIWDDNRSMEGDLTAWEFSLKKQIDGYSIYVDDNAYLGL